MKHIIELTDIIEHIVLAEQIVYLLAGKGFINLIALHAEYSKLCFLTHSTTSLHIGELYLAVILFISSLQI